MNRQTESRGGAAYVGKQKDLFRRPNISFMYVSVVIITIAIILSTIIVLFITISVCSAFDQGRIAITCYAEEKVFEIRGFFAE